MNPLTPNRKQTKKSCLANALVGLVLAVVMALCAVVTGADAPETRQNLLLATGLLLLVTAWWVYRFVRFEEKDFDDPFHLGKD
jgi:high-affinity Fe2+/Pb2+ permease